MQLQNYEANLNKTNQYFMPMKSRITLGPYLPDIHLIYLYLWELSRTWEKQLVTELKCLRFSNYRTLIPWWMVKDSHIYFFMVTDIVYPWQNQHFHGSKVSASNNLHDTNIKKLAKQTLSPAQKNEVFH